MTLTIGLLGDVYLDRDGAADPFRMVGLDRGDFWFANLEAPISEAADDARAHRAWTTSAFQMRPAVVSHLTGITAMSVANNHALDYGPDAYCGSIKLLNDAGIGHAGGGRNVAEARRPLVRSKEGRSVAFLAYTCLYQDGWAATESQAGMATVRVHTTYEAPLRVFEQPGWPPTVHTFVDLEDRAVVEDEIRSARDTADIVVASFHWGLSTGARSVVEYQLELGRLAIDAGADAVFGHHPHTLQPLIIHRGRPIFLSLGNIVFDYDKAWRGDPDTVAARLYFEDAGLTRIGITPLQRDEHSDPVPAAPDERQRIIDRLIPAPSGEQFEHIWHDEECIVTMKV